jgi:60 kDa SS-A/Ro ribonucleoprotein
MRHRIDARINRCHQENDMVSTQLFQTHRGALLPAADARNHEGAPAYAFEPRHQLAQLAATGCLGTTFYASAETQLDVVLALTRELDVEFIAKAAIHAREAGHMKDMPALLLAVLAVRDVQLLAKVFGRVIDSGKMLLNFVQIVRSGVTGRKSLGSRPKALIQQWLLQASETQLLHASIGSTPSLADVVKMVHPKPSEPWRAAWFAWLIGKTFDEAALPPKTMAFERFKRALREGDVAATIELPDVPFQMLTALELGTAQWAAIARNGSWQMVRQSLNTFERHGVFEQDGMTEAIATKLCDREAIARARVLPYQLLAAFKSTAGGVPAEVRAALQDAMDIALANVPAIVGQVVICPDVSGSMSSSITGQRGSATSAMRCIDVAALIAAAMLDANPLTRVLPFEQRVVDVDVNPRDSVMTNAAKLAAIGGGGTNVSAPLAKLVEERVAVDLVVIVSDYESWVDATRAGSTETMRQWQALKVRCPDAKLVCIDLVPHGTTQALERADVMNVGGFSDAVFHLLASFSNGAMDAGHWVGEIERIALDAQ